MSRVNKANKMLWSKQKFIPGIHHYSQTNVKNTAHTVYRRTSALLQLTQ